MSREQIEQRIKDKQTAVEQLEAAHQKFVAEVNKQFAHSRDEYNKLVGSIAELKTFLDDPPDA